MQKGPCLLAFSMERIYIHNNSVINMVVLVLKYLKDQTVSAALPLFNNFEMDTIICGNIDVQMDRK